MKEEYYLEADYYQLCKAGQLACGDSFYSRKLADRIVTVLADGLGSGIKASVLATLTTTMASNFIRSNMDIVRAAEVIMETLPVCSYRKIGYSTFTISDASYDGKIRIIEHDNPSFIHIRNAQLIDTPKKEIVLQNERKSILYYSELELQPNDRIVFFSDGVSQSGMGLPRFPLGWGEAGAQNYVMELLKENPYLSAGEISKKLVMKAKEFDGGAAADDITCATIYMRKPRHTLLVTGPPYIPAHDKELANIVSNYDGKKVICGGTTAEIVSREIGLPVLVNVKDVNNADDVPPIAHMQGFELVTEGTITLSKILKVLELDPPLESLADNAVKKLLRILLDSDIIRFVVGTKINDAHQDPALPKDLEIRRNLIKRISRCLEDKYLKETSVEYI